MIWEREREKERERERLDIYIYILQGRTQDLWLWGTWVGEGSGDRLRSPLGPQWVKGRALVALGVWRITDIYLNDNFEPTTPFLSNQKNLES